MLLAVFTLVFLGCSQQAAAQWTTNGNDINNTNSGSVGIGTTTPLHKLDVGGNMTIGSGFNSATTVPSNGLIVEGSVAIGATSPGGAKLFLYGGNDAGSANGIHLSSTDGATTEFGFFSSNASADYLRFGYWNGSILKNIFFDIGTTGKVGFGTNAPAVQLHLLGNDTTQARIETSGNASASIDFKNPSRRWVIGTGLLAGGGDFSIYDNNAALTRMYFDTSGNVAIGSTSPGYRLDVQGGQINASGGLCIAGDCKTAWSQVGGSGGGGGTITGVTAGAGLTGGGTSGAVTLDIGAGNGLSVAADNISVNYGATAGTAVQGNTSVTVSAGTGMSGGGSITLGSGGSLTLTNADTGSAQSIFKNIGDSAGTTQFSAASNTATLSFQGSGGTTVSFDATAKKVIIDGSTSSIAATNVTAGQFGAGNYTFPGNVTVNGNINAKYQDMAEWVPADRALMAGTVTILNPNQSNQVMASTTAYDTSVAGVVSEQPGIALGEAGANKVLVATTGRVRVKVDATRAPIRIGDLLVTSDVEGVAMKSQPINVGGVAMHRPGTLIGKALEPLPNGTGTILVLLSLQ
jgi:hypothetical protein